MNVEIGRRTKFSIIIIGVSTADVIDKYEIAINPVVSKLGGENKTSLNIES